MKKILCVVGTRPEAIKMAPVILGLKQQKWADVKVLVTAQHREMLDQVHSFFEITPDIDLDLMKPSQTLANLTSNLLARADEVLQCEKPDIVLVQGDTTTVMSLSLACFYRGIPIGHIEAGLRTWDINNPFPEEMNRVFVGKIASLHFAPTKSAKENLLKDGISEDKIYITGNTVIDALKLAANKIPDTEECLSNKRIVLVTSHRRENFGEPLKEICSAIKALAVQNPDVQFVYPVHPNPNVRTVVSSCLQGIKNCSLINPLSYPDFVAQMKSAFVILTDSGGVQEEAPALGKPVLVLRDETERPEAVEEGVVKLVGPHVEKIIRETQLLLDDKLAYAAMAKGTSPYGDGNAAKRIIDVLKTF